MNFENCGKQLLAYQTYRQLEREEKIYKRDNQSV